MLQVADTLIKVYNYVQEVKGAKKEICDLYAELLALKGVLEQLLDSILDDLGARKGGAGSRLNAFTWPYHKASVELPSRDSTRFSVRL